MSRMFGDYHREKSPSEIEDEIKRRWDERVKKEVNLAEERYKARTNLDILEYHEDSKRRMNFYTPNETEERRIVEIIKQTDADFDSELFEKYAEYVLRDFFRSYTNQSMDSLRNCVDINIIALFNSRIYQNNLSGIRDYFEINDVNYVDFFGYQKESNLEIISVAVGISFLGYKKKNEIVISGSDKYKQRGTYLLSFARKIGGKTINNLKCFNGNEITCFNCGAKIQNSSNKCEYCGTIMYNSTENWLLNHIEQL